MWPVCHLAHERPIFRSADWDHYVKVNRRFATAILEEIGSGDAMVLVQDYHLALVPEMLKAERPDIRVGIFWHIPWPNPESFRICPWREQILKGMLGADLVGFHLQQYCNNFLDTVDRMVEARLDWDHFAVELRGHRSLVRPFPISVESWAERNVPTGDALANQIGHLKEQHKLENCEIIVGVDRIDYTKGLPERFAPSGDSSRSTHSIAAKCTYRATRCAQPHAHPPLSRSDRRTGIACRRDQLEVSDRRLEADPLPGLASRRFDGARLHANVVGLPRQFAARRHEPGRQGIRRGQTGRRRRAGVCPSSPVPPANCPMRWSSIRTTPSSSPTPSATRWK